QTKPYWAKKLPPLTQTFYGVGFAKERSREDSIDKALELARINLAQNISRKLAQLDNDKILRNLEIKLTEEEAIEFAKDLEAILLADDNLTGITKMTGDKEYAYFVMTEISISKLIKRLEASEEITDLSIKSIKILKSLK
ncbi:MAG: hypothetical protein JXR63_12975, partial [Spirochaetales bacterium]|nr:hypothetical protein [Spirochaetales bacterium]